MKTRRRTPRRRIAEISLDSVLAASTRLSLMHESLTGQGYVCSGGKLNRTRDGSWTARIVWRKREAGLSVSFSEQGLRLA